MAGRTPGPDVCVCLCQTLGVSTQHAKLCNARSCEVSQMHQDCKLLLFDPLLLLPQQGGLVLCCAVTAGGPTSAHDTNKHSRANSPDMATGSWGISHTMPEQKLAASVMSSQAPSGGHSMAQHSTAQHSGMSVQFQKCVLKLR
jgi:hypothetical protein